MATPLRIKIVSQECGDTQATESTRQSRAQPQSTSIHVIAAPSLGLAEVVLIFRHMPKEKTRDHL
ncbi:hypothetical protein [Noviherbaspirillum cavernae]|uniref:hypothetical protein n=1 Tax=Noviherbaspirillum cavernae TaxID=2320862 RepID=UPI0011C40CC7|nr:hypothetical protein [Noviherbaspirillum cavernae]